MQWLDPASAGVIQIAFRRLRMEQVGLLATVRLAHDLASPVELDRSFPASRLVQLAIGPLSMGAVHALLEERLALDLTRPELVRVQEATAGNPFFALELGRELVRTGTRPAPGQALRVPESLRELLGGRLARLPAETVDVLVQVAALARPTVQLVAAVYGDDERVVEALEAGVREGVAELDESRIRFTHPLLASICYEQAPVWKRRAVHRALASAVSDLEERSRHLALAAEGPDSVVASNLEAAAEQAAARGAPAAAGELSELAAELTPNDPELARQRRLRAAHFRRLAGDGEHAAAILEQLLAEAPAGVERADVLFELVQTYRVDTPKTIELCNEALAEAFGDDVRATRILGFRSLNRLLQTDVRGALSDARAALETAERTGDARADRRGDRARGTRRDLDRRDQPGACSNEASSSRSVSGSSSSSRAARTLFLGRLLIRLGDPDRARTALEWVEGAASARGDEMSRVISLWYLSIVEWFAGRWQRALEHATTAREVGEQAQVAHTPMWVGRVQALVETDLGLVDQARASAERGLAIARATANEAFVMHSLGVLGRLELELGNTEAAGRYLRDLPAQFLAAGWNDPVQPIWADALETLIALGELELARSYLERYELHAQRLGAPWPLAGARRCGGLLAAAEARQADALEAFDQALALLEAHPFPLERGRTLLCLGVVRRQAQQKKPAREALEQALAIFEELGARLWAEKARAELRRISGRRPPDEELTETERRVAELAAHGRTNKEIAAELFMGVSTVEAHLSRVYRTLGIRSRTELATRLAVTLDAAATD